MGNSIPPDNNEPETPPCGEVSGLLRAWSDGDRNALDKLTPIVYDELHRLARSYMKRERTGHSLQTSALVNEAYMRLVALDSAMDALERIDRRKVQVVEMRFFGGLSVEETAAVLNVSAVTVMRDWSTAKAWLYRELGGGTGDGFQSMET